MSQQFMVKLKQILADTTPREAIKIRVELGPRAIGNEEEISEAFTKLADALHDLFEGEAVVFDLGIIPPEEKAGQGVGTGG